MQIVNIKIEIYLRVLYKETENPEKKGKRVGDKSDKERKIPY
jgi:hypothetical protein